MKHLSSFPFSHPASARRRHRQTGLYFDDVAPDSAWLRDRASVVFPPLDGIRSVSVHGELICVPDANGEDPGFPALCARFTGRSAQRIRPKQPGAFRLDLDVPPGLATAGAALHLKLEGVGLTNTLAWAARITGFKPWQRYRQQARNRQLRIIRIEADGEIVYDFSQRQATFSPAFARIHLTPGLNIVGFIAADLGIGESARCMIRAADAAGLPTALVPLRLNCKNPSGDTSYVARLQDSNPYGFNVVHLDPPAAHDIDHHHGRAFRAKKYNIGYWAWELPTFPDGWVSACDYFDEIWCPSNFVREAISMKAPVPVLTMPHAIAFNRPTESVECLRSRLQLPPNKLLFLFLYDLNSYSLRKNPQAVIDAFRAAGLGAEEAALVIKVHNAPDNEADIAALRAAVADLPGTVLITETLSRADLYALEAACDVFVSLHRSEGFGLAVAECMYLGKPVIATDWSATAEFLDCDNGCPVRARIVPLERSVGPYAKGQLWAEPDVEQAADWMRRLAADPALRARLGAAARATIERRFAPAVIGERYRERLLALSVL